MDELRWQLQQIHVLLEDGDRAALRPAQLTPTQFTLLSQVANGPDVGMTVTQLATSLLCTRGNAARLVRRLHETGLVATRGDDHDQRLVVVQLTPQGRRRLADARRRLSAAVARRFLLLTPRDFEQLARSADGLAAALRRDIADERGGASGTSLSDADDDHIRRRREPRRTEA